MRYRAYEQGWATLTNRALLEAAERAGFDVFLTTDQNLRYQQNLIGRHLAIIVLQSMSWPRIRTQVAAIQAVSDTIVPGTYHEIPIRKTMNYTRRLCCFGYVWYASSAPTGRGPADGGMYRAVQPSTAEAKPTASAHGAPRSGGVPRLYPFRQLYSVGTKPQRSLDIALEKEGAKMSNTIVLELPDRVQEALNEAIREEGLSPNELVTAALEDYLFIRKFRRLRERMLTQAPEKYTDEDIFERVS